MMSRMKNRQTRMGRKFLVLGCVLGVMVSAGCGGAFQQPLLRERPDGAQPVGATPEAGTSGPGANSPQSGAGGGSAGTR
jgi:hypothetical protein